MRSVLRKAALPLLALAVLALAGAGVRSHESAAAAVEVTAPCGLPNAVPTWFDFGGVDFWTPVVSKGQITIASSYPAGQWPPFPRTIPRSIYFDLHLNNRVGTPDKPADPSTIIAKADKFFAGASASSRCATPYIAENELFGAWTPWPLTPTADRYRANVLTFLRRLAADGARPFLLINSVAYTGGDAAEWWRQVAQVADIVREAYFSAPQLAKQGPIRGSRTMRQMFRRDVAPLLAIGIPPSRLGLMLGFQTKHGSGGREGLKPKAAWLEIVKLETLAAKQVASELKLATLWSWGWAPYSQDPANRDNHAAACVYLWTRAAGFCDGPAAAGPGFDSSRTEGQLILPAGAQCIVGKTQIRGDAMAPLTSVTGDSQVAFSAMMSRVAARQTYDITTAQLLAAERALVKLRFGGSTRAYRSALSRAHASLAVARGVIGDELRRVGIETSLRVAGPSERQIESYYETYASAPARFVRVKPAPWWLGNRQQGLALGGVAPPQLFRLGNDVHQTVRTMERAYDVETSGASQPLGSIPLSTVRPAIRAALVALARDDRFDTWLAGREQTLLNSTVCAHDQLPQVSSIDLTTYLPFLALDAGDPEPFFHS